MSGAAGEGGPREPLADVTVTAATRKDAERLAETLVGERWAACGNLAAIRSVYRWQGAVESGDEVLLLLHTRASLVPGVIDRVLELHDYDEPQVVAIPVLAASPGYHAWVLESTRGPGEA